ncbi:MAG: hypothetical protein AMJ43_01530 [Coxiella sp. DG_40]|nr:MAG: hypothetical protein AMJ43_01530 [Coxiella sp. DG_40]
MFKAFLLAYVLLLVGCAVGPVELGISQQQWNKYNPEKQQEILTAHKELLRAKREDQTLIGDSWLEVDIKGGSVMMPPFIKRYEFAPVTFKIREGTCRINALHNYKSSNSIKLDCCYKNDILFLDPSRYEIDKKDGTVRLYFSPLWRQGFIYKNINSDGYARLHNVTIKIKSGS